MKGCSSIMLYERNVISARQDDIAALDSSESALLPKDYSFRMLYLAQSIM